MYLQFDKKIRKDENSNFSITAPGHYVVRLVKNAFAYTLYDARIYTSAGIETEQNKFVGLISTIMRLITQNDGGLSTYFDIIDESEARIDNSSLKQTLINNHTTDNRGIIRGHLPLETIFGFCKSFKKIIKGVRFELDL